METQRPILVALALDHEASGVLTSALALGSRLATEVVVVHAIAARRLESPRGVSERVAAARAELERRLAPLRAAGVVVADLVIEVGHAAELTLATASRVAAQMIVTGGGRPATLRRWMVGSVTEAIVRGSTAPVWVVRGEPPVRGPLLCPIDLSPESRVGLDAALPIARLFGRPLSLLYVIRDEMMEGPRAARREIEELLGDYELDGVAVRIEVRVGDPAQQIVEAAGAASLVVIASRGYDPLVPEWLGPVTSRVLRHSPCNTLTVRHVSEGHERRVRSLTRAADAYQRVKVLLADGRAQEALPTLERLAEELPANAAIQASFALALEQLDRRVEAAGRREIARLIREQIG